MHYPFDKKKLKKKMHYPWLRMAIGLIETGLPNPKPYPNH